MSELHSKNWPLLAPYVAFCINSYVHKVSGFSPGELFLGRPLSFLTIRPDSESGMKAETWLGEHLQIQEAVRSLLLSKRKKKLTQANRRRISPAFEVGHYILVKRSRFPQWPCKKLSSPYFGPFRILCVKPSSLLLKVSPYLGSECDVAFEFVKRFPHPAHFDDANHFDPENDSDNDFDLQPEISLQDDFSAGKDCASAEISSPELLGVPSQTSPSLVLHPSDSTPGNKEKDSPSGSSVFVTPGQKDASEIASPEEAALQGFYKVETILNHKVKQGYRFLTKWEGFEASESTWEPVKAFVHPDGTLNNVFVAYCQFHRLFVPLQRAYTLSQKC
jgi:hypothetical protein